MILIIFQKKSFYFFCRLKFFINPLRKQKMANITTNRSNTSISPADAIALMATQNAIILVLAPYLKSLTDEERNSLFSLDVENLVFANDALLQIKNLIDFVP